MGLRLRLRRPGQKKFVAAVIGVLLAGLPLAAFDIWLDRVIERQIAEDTSGDARRTIGIIDGRLSAVVAGLEGLAAQGVSSCGPAELEKLRRAAFLTAPAKEFSVIGTDGQTLCTDLGIPLGPRKVVTTTYNPNPGDVVIEVVHLGEHPSNYLRVRRFGTNGSLAALVPPELLIPVASVQGGPLNAYAQVYARDQLLIGEGGKALPPDAKADDLVSTTLRSPRFGITVRTTMPRSASAASDMRTVGLIVNMFVLFAVLSFAWATVRRRGSDPLGEIRRALDAGEFVPYYQPIVDMETGRAVGAEVLVRWRKPDGSLVLPGAFIPTAERGGLMVELTEALMRRARAEVGEAYAQRPKLTIAFNLTAKHFADETIVADLRDIFDRSPIHLSQVTLELTEREPIGDVATTRRVIAALQGLGCKVALDDVGTGHSGLSSILKLGVDVIKIDKMFIDSLGTERNSATIVTTLVELARNMRMEIVAEGVESFEQVADLRARGIRAAQGYVFAPPLPASSFLTLLEALNPVQAQGAKETGARGQRVA
jgi:sensor c-di-GMP phosphodiesterase-like protein